MIKPLSPISLPLALIILIFVAPRAMGQRFFEKESAFVITRDNCNATRSLRRGAEVPLVRGRTYTVIGKNKEGGTHLRIQTEQGERWVNRECGSFTHFPFRPAQPPRQSLLPFFDNINNPVDTRTGRGDMTPPPPRLSNFDRQLLNLCGREIGSPVDPVAFRRVITNHPNLLRTLNIDADTFQSIWFNGDGFKHIFCGEINPENGSLWGLHWAPRFLQLQQNRLAGRLANNTAREEILPNHIYTFGVDVKINGQWQTSPIKGYSLSLSSEDLLRIGTQTYLRNPNPSDEPQSCQLPVTAGNTTYKAVFASKSGGIRTFYPDATPSPTRNRCN